MSEHSKTSKVVTVAVVCAACLVGVVLDLRLESLRDGDARASLGTDLVVVPEPERQLRERIEVASGLKGRPLLSLEEWRAVEPIVIDGVDVSNMFSGEFIYSGSLSSDFRFSGAVVDAVFSRAGTFLDLGVPSGPNTSTVFRFSARGVEPFRRIGRGPLEPVDHTAFPSTEACSHFQVVTNPGEQSVVCDGITRLQIKVRTGQQGGVWVASNLTGGEVRELKISG